MNNFWYWTSTFNTIFTAVIPGLYVGRNMFWIGMMSYVSENSKFEGRSLKHGIIIATYTFSLLIGWGLIAILKKNTDHLHRYLLFVVPILFNLFAILIGHLYIEDNSDTYDRDIIWFRPNSIFKSFIDLFKNKFKGFSIVLATLIICQSVIVARIGSKLIIIYTLYYTQYINTHYVCICVYIMNNIYNVLLYPLKLIFQVNMK